MSLNMQEVSSQEAAEPIISAEIGAAIYTGARNEIIQRIVLRDRALGLFLGAVSAVVTITAASSSLLSNNNELSRFVSYGLLLIPLFSFVGASIVSQHHALIGAIENFLVTDLGPALRRSGLDFPQWDSSKQVLEMKDFSIAIRGNQWVMPLVGLVISIAFLSIQVETFVENSVLTIELDDIGDYVQFSRIFFINRIIEVGAFSVAVFLVVRSWLVLSYAKRKRGIYLREMKKYA